MKSFIIAMVASLVAMSGGCGSNNSTPPPSLAYLEVAPAILSPSPSDGMPLSYAALNPQDVPIIQCPHNPSVAGIVICEFSSGVPDTICVPWSTLTTDHTNQKDYLGPCK